MYTVFLPNLSIRPLLCHMDQFKTQKCDDNSNVADNVDIKVKYGDIPCKLVCVYNVFQVVYVLDLKDALFFFFFEREKKCIVSKPLSFIIYAVSLTYLHDH